MEETLYINTPGIQWIIYFIIFVVILVILKLFIGISKKQNNLRNRIDIPNHDYEYYKSYYLEKINDQSFSKRPKSIFFLLEKSLTYFKPDLEEKDYKFFVKEFEKIDPNNLTSEDVELLKKYYKKITN